MESKRKNTLQGFWKVDSMICRIAGTISKVTPFIIIIMALGATVNVIINKTLGTSIPSVNDWISFLMIPVVWLCLAQVTLKGKLVSVDFLSKHFPVILNRIIQALGYLIGAAVTFYIMTRQWSLMKSNYESGKLSSTSGLNFVLWPFSAILAIGLGLSALAFIWMSVRQFVPERQEG